MHVLHHLSKASQRIFGAPAEAHCATPADRSEVSQQPQWRTHVCRLRVARIPAARRSMRRSDQPSAAAAWTTSDHSLCPTFRSFEYRSAPWCKTGPGIPASSCLLQLLGLEQLLRASRHDMTQPLIHALQDPRQAFDAAATASVAADDDPGAEQQAAQAAHEALMRIDPTRLEAALPDDLALQVGDGARPLIPPSAS